MAKRKAKAEMPKERGFYPSNIDDLNAIFLDAEKRVVADLEKTYKEMDGELDSGVGDDDRKFGWYTTKYAGVERPEARDAFAAGFAKMVAELGSSKGWSFPSLGEARKYIFKAAFTEVMDVFRAAERDEKRDKRLGISKIENKLRGESSGAMATGASWDTASYGTTPEDEIEAAKRQEELRKQENAELDAIAAAQLGITLEEFQRQQR